MSNAAKTPHAWWPEAAADWSEAERDLLARLSPDRMPRHVGVIMDGNGRWARQRGFIDRIRGHEAGIESVREISRTSAELRLEVLTLYAFSKENWNRPRAEINALMTLLARFLVEERSELMENNIRLEAIGSTEDLPESARRRLNETREMTAGNTGLNLVLALSYGSRDEMVRAVRSLAHEIRQGRLEPDQINPDTLSRRLDTAAWPDPDLIIRTSGEMRISNFLLWQAAYAELYVTPVLWPDFRRTHLLEALCDFQRRERRYGGVIEPTPKES